MSNEEVDVLDQVAAMLTKLINHRGAPTVSSVTHAELLATESELSSYMARTMDLAVRLFNGDASRDELERLESEIVAHPAVKRLRQGMADTNSDPVCLELGHCLNHIWTARELLSEERSQHSKVGSDPSLRD